MIDARATVKPSSPRTRVPPVVGQDSNLVSIESIESQNLNDKSEVLSHRAHERQRPVTTRRAQRSKSVYRP